MIISILLYVWFTNEPIESNIVLLVLYTGTIIETKSGFIFNLWDEFINLLIFILLIIFSLFLCNKYLESTLILLLFFNLILYKKTLFF